MASALGADLPVLIDLVPLLEKLFPRSELANQKIEISPSEAEDRTLRVLQSFLSCIAFDDQPLVLFIDDLQWSSAAEVSVLTALISSFDPHSSFCAVHDCLWIISYRINEVPEATLEKLSESLDRVRRKSNPSETRGAVEIQVGPLHHVCPL